jgi:DNA-binding transcriptional MerR regulator
MGQAAGQGWSITDVERLVGLSRRDIKRACYEGEGGVGVLRPQDEGWGRRTYDEHDLTMLFLVAEHRREGMTLSQAARQLRYDELTQTTGQLLKQDADRLMDRMELLADRLVRAQALAASLDEEPVRTQRLHDMSERMGHIAHAVVGHTAPPAQDLPGSELLIELMGNGMGPRC